MVTVVVVVVVVVVDDEGVVVDDEGVVVRADRGATVVAGCAVTGATAEGAVAGVEPHPASVATSSTAGTTARIQPAHEQRRAPSRDDRVATQRYRIADMHQCRGGL
jgi:hypothetical protein